MLRLTKAVALLAMLLTAGCGGRSGSADAPPDLWDDIQERGVLRVAMTLQFPPQFYRDPVTREPAGYDVEMLQMMAKDLGVKLDIQDMDFTGQIPALLAGRVDMIANGLVNTPERAKTILFTEPYVPYQLLLMVQRGTTLKTPEDLDAKGRVVAVLLGSVSHEFARLRFPNAELRPLERQDACMMEVASKKADACLMEQHLAIPFARNNPQTTAILASDPPLAVQYGCLALPQGSPRLLYWVNNWIKYYKANGLLDAMYDRTIGPSLVL